MKNQKIMGQIKNYKIIISGGGTGGHIFPAISIANALKSKIPDVDILFVGAKGNMEMQKVPEAGYQIKGLPIKGFNRKLPHKNIPVIFNLIVSMVKAKKIIKDFKPDAVVGVGGYASGPILRIATQKKIPALIQEQNSYAGITNRLLAKKVNKICVAYNGMSRYFPEGKIIFTGNPVRDDLENITNLRQEAIQYFGLDLNLKTLLVLGGSLGAKIINQCILENVNILKANDIQLIWQTGTRFYDEIIQKLSGKSLINLKVKDFISRMDLAYAASDLVITRAGASTISELCLVAKPAVLVPSPNVAEDHQTKNAIALVAENAARFINDDNVLNELIPSVLALIKNDKILNDMSQNISKLAIRNSASLIADEVIKLVHNE